MDYIMQLDLINENILELNEKLEILPTLNQALLNLNGYFYILLFSLAGVGFFLLLYKFLKIFL